jgi:hypothetical protein
MKRIANQAGILPVIAIALVSFASGSFGADMVLAKGSFVGKSGHAVSGMVSIVKTSSGVEVRLAPDFKLDSAPDPYLGFGKAGKYVKATQFSKLNKNDGQQTYKVPARIDVSEYDEVYVWCRPFNVPLGVARLSK